MDTAVWCYMDLLNFICISLVLARWRELLPVRSQGLVVIVLNNVDSPLSCCDIRHTLIASYAGRLAGGVIPFVFFQLIVICWNRDVSIRSGARGSLVCDVWPMLWMYPCGMTAITFI